MFVYEKELLAIMFVVCHWHYYLITYHFTIRTNQKSLKHLLEQKVSTPLQHVWLSKLMVYDYDIAYKKGCENSADSLSEVSGAEVSHLSIFALRHLLLDQIVSTYAADVDLKQILVQLRSLPILATPIHFSYDGRTILCKGKIVVSRD